MAYLFVEPLLLNLNAHTLISPWLFYFTPIVVMCESEMIFFLKKERKKLCHCPDSSGPDCRSYTSLSQHNCWKWLGGLGYESIYPTIVSYPNPTIPNNCVSVVEADTVPSCEIIWLIWPHMSDLRENVQCYIYISQHV